ncbi:MAG: aldo/keto reductase [Burkholderiales bacterium]|nr:aldo/keto reductase [Burkholderiales bacterium]
MADDHDVSSRRKALRLLAALPALAAMTHPTRASAAPALATRPIPKSGEALPVVGLGTWRVFDVGAERAARARLSEVLTLFAAGGAKLVDSSPMYGSAESVVGDLASALGLRKQLFLATKVWTSGREDGIAQMERSIARMHAGGTIDLIQVHNLVDVATHTKTLEDWKAKGRVRYIGITHYTASAHAALERWLKSGGYDFVQVNYSLDEPEAAERLLPLAQEKRAAVLVNRPFGEGGMFARVRGKALPAWAAELGIASWAQYFLKWILGHPAVTCVIPGTGNPKHIVDNLAAGRGALPDEAMRRRMAQHFDSL